MKTKERFEVSTAGMRDLQSGRLPWQLAKELISNVFDEDATVCRASLKSTAPRRAVLTVYDDGAGFAKIADAWTLMGYTPKRTKPNVRGRFNIGEKEILSVAIEATVRTSGKIVRFPKSGGRRVSKNPDKATGTEIRCVLPWGPRQVEQTVDALKKILPPAGFSYEVNGEAIPHRQPHKIAQATLDTIISTGPGQPLQSSRRKTDIELTPSPNGGMLYEMGIPVQDIECPFLINVQQKVPMPPNRDVVRDSYLRDIYAIVLTETIDELQDVSDTWVRIGVAKEGVPRDVIEKVLHRRYGDKVVLWSSDSRANEKARLAGHEVIHARYLDANERQAYESVGLQHSSEAFPTQYGDADLVPESEWTNGMKRVADYAKSLARELIGKDIRICIYRQFGGAGATYNAMDRTLSFNLSNLGKAWFVGFGPHQTGLILHELAHDKGNSHDWEYHNHLEKLAGKAVHLALDRPEIFREGV